ncbi:transcriptional regulator [Panacibacter ginsenosidivorans]|uniref:Transcriptional regulator n=1 Tax=Panacibacter ginsenosidivorans TaxID=1813871 RepID=A0A5B8VB85_9BACT|nr:transcriptional regulator [Panacibacter ginsenosidivorans]QEC67926.1 transcriptional regulator [Panacibacter ginsenosidivorans]
MQDIKDAICEYIKQRWIDPWEGSTRSFATAHDVDEKIIRKIANYKESSYSISVSSLEKMCTAREITLELFFKAIQR